MKALKSIGAVLAGIVTLVILSVVTDMILESTGVFPPPNQGLHITWMLTLALIYRCIYQILGGYVAAALAPDKPMRHINIMGIIGVVLSLIGVIVGWDLSDHWYPIALAVLAFPTVWLGGKLRTRNANA
jgi:hypothetical protein